MKYAVPTSGGALCSHFGHCEQFAIIDIDADTRQVTGKEMVTPPPHEPGVFPAWLAEQGVSVVIAGGMGQRAVMLFEQNNISVVTGSMETDPERAVLSHVGGSLEIGDNTCNEQPGTSCEEHNTAF